jgi:C1A family cysteine protease
MAPSVALPPLVDLRPQCHAVEDQLNLGACTSFAAGEAIRMAREKQGLPDFVTSHLFLYYNSRSKSTKSVDAGATIRDTIKAAATFGDCAETDWPYDISKFASKPPAQSYTDAKTDRAISYLRVAQSLTQIKNCLAQGFSLDIGFTVYQSFESQQVADTGIVPMPSKRESVLGGHSVLVVGYRDSDSRFICKNSWSASWGDKGYFYMPYAYLQDSGLSSDFWTVRAIG